MFSKIAGALAIGAAIICCSPANAVTVTTYTLAMTPIPNTGTVQLSGTGLLVINSAVGPNVTFHSTDSPQLVTTLNLTIGGFTFNMLTNWADVRFQTGALNDITAGPIVIGSASLSISNITSVFFNQGNGNFAFDTVSVQSVTVTDGGSAAATPIPAALPLFASGAGVLGFYGWRRKRKAAAFAG